MSFMIEIVLLEFTIDHKPMRFSIQLHWLMIFTTKIAWAIIFIEIA